MIKVIEIINAFLKEIGEYDNSNIIRIEYIGGKYYEVEVKDTYNSNFVYMVNLNNNEIYNSEGLNVKPIL